MTFQDLLDRIGQRLNIVKGAMTTETTARLLGFMNERHRQALRKAPKLRNGQLAMTTVSGQQKYALPPCVDTVKDIYDPAVNMRKLDCRDLSFVRTFDPRAQIVSFGAPTAWVDNGYVAAQNDVATSPAIANGSANGCAVYAVSSSAGDTANVTIEFLRQGGYPGSATHALTGVTPFQLSGVTDVVEITKMYLGNNAVGFVTLHAANATGTLLSTIGPGGTYARFKSILLWPTPNDSSLVLFYDYVRVIPDALNNINDEPLLPLDFHNILIAGVLQDEYQKMNDARYAIASAEWNAGLAELEDSVLNNDDWVVIPNGPLPVPYPFHLPVTG